jgi:hypothetical protein
MDVQRSWKKLSRGEWQCGRFYVSEFIGRYDVWLGDGVRLLAQNLRSVAEAKRWIKDHWRGIEAAEGPQKNP